MSACAAPRDAGSVLLAGHGLPQRWQGREQWVVLDTAFGLGCNFIALLRTWRDDPQRSRTLHVLAVDQHPPPLEDLRRAWHPLLATPGAFIAHQGAGAHDANDPAQASMGDDVRELIAGWPPPVPGVHLLTFAQGRVRLQLTWGDVHTAMREWVARVDAFLLDGLALARSPDTRHADAFRGVRRLAAPDATAVSSSATPAMFDGLRMAGFRCEAVATSRPDQPALRARKVPMKSVYDTQALCGPQLEPSVDEVLVVGAGLAGAHVVRSLAARGVRCVVMEAASDLAQGSSAGPGGIFHATVHREDGVHARVLRAAALVASQSHAQAVAAGVHGQVQGLLRIDRGSSDTLQSSPHDESVGEPARTHANDWARHVTDVEAARLSGLRTPRASGALRGWWFARGGWIDPQGLVRHLLRQATPVLFNTSVHRLTPANDASSAWVAHDANGRELGRWRCVVLANAHDAARLCPWAAWPLSRVRGQSETLPPGAVRPPLLAPVSGDGYALPLRDGSIAYGATSHVDDEETNARASDAQANLERLLRLTGADLDPTAWPISRVGWRVSTPDRLPLVGAVPSPDAGTTRAFGTPLARHWKRARGLYVATAFGSRGLTLAPLAGELIAAAVFREPLPLEASLVAALDPARFAARASQDAKDSRFARETHR